MFGRAAQRAPQPAHGGATDRQAFHLLQLLGGVAVIQVPVCGGQQLDHAPPQPPPQAARRGPSAAAVQQPLGALRLEAPAQAPDLPLAQL